MPTIDQVQKLKKHIESLHGMLERLEGRSEEMIKQYPDAKDPAKLEQRISNLTKTIEISEACFEKLWIKFLKAHGTNIEED